MNNQEKSNHKEKINIIDSFTMDYRENNINNIYIKNKSSSNTCADKSNINDSCIENNIINIEDNSNYLTYDNAFKKYKKKSPFLKGVFVLSFTLLLTGWFAIVLNDQSNNINNPNINQNDINTIICSVVMQDPEPFNNISEANPNMITCASLWYTILSHQDDGYDYYDEYNRIVIPLEDVQQSSKMLFGSKNNLQLKNPDEPSFFEMDFENNLVYVLPYSNCDCFTPSITSIENTSNDSTVVKVGYISPLDPYRSPYEQDDNIEPVPEKYMNYIFKKDTNNSNFYISAVLNSE